MTFKGSPTQGSRIMMKIAALLVTLASICLQTWSAHAVRSSLYPEDWTPEFTDGQGRFLHDFSYAGYHNGEAVPPDTGALPLFDVVTGFGADNTGAADATTALQQAIDTAESADGGVVFLPAGTYRCDGALTVNASNIILRGEGTTATFVYFTSVPSSAGTGHITFRGIVTRSNEALLAEDGQSRFFEVRVEDASGFAVGDNVAVGWVITDEFIAEHGMTGTWVSFNGQWKPFFRREIVAIDLVSMPNVITLDVPLRYPAKMRDGASLRREEGYLKECGVEAIALSNAVEKTAAWSQDQIHVLGMDGVKDSYICNVGSFQSPVADDTSEKHLQSSGIRVGGSKRVTVSNCRMEKAQNRGDGGNGYLYEVRYSSEILYRDCIAQDGRHNFIQNWDFGATGIVWLRCESTGSTAVTLFGSAEIPVRAYSEYHHSLSMACLVDSCVFGDGWATGNRGDWSSGAGHTATETALWNTKGLGEARIRSFNYAQGYVIGTEDIEVYVETDPTLGALHVGTAPNDFTEFIEGAKYLRPQSLYESQRNTRLGLPQAEEGEPPPSDFVLTYDGPATTITETGERLELIVEAQNSVDEVHYQWYLVGEGETLQPLPGATTNVLVFETVTPAHAGRYVCVATDAIGETRSPEITLQVKAQMPLSGATLCAFLLILAAILLIPSKRARAGA